MSQEITVLIKVFDFIKCLLNNFMLSRTKCLLNNTSKSFTYAYLNFLWMMILPRYTWNLSVLLVLIIFLTNLILSYSDKYLFVYVGIFSGAVYFLSEIFLEIVHLLVGILLNPLLPKKTYAPESVFFFLYLFQLADTCFRRYLSTWNSLIYSRFTWKIEMY